MSEQLVDHVRRALAKAASEFPETHPCHQMFFSTRDKFARAAIAAVDEFRAASLFSATSPFDLEHGDKLRIDCPPLKAAD